MPHDAADTMSDDLRRLIRASDHHRCDPGRLEAVSGSLRAPASAVRIGQTRLSFHHVRAKLDAMIARLEAWPLDVPVRFFELLADDAIHAVLGPAGRFAVAQDGNHKLAALRALDGLILTDPAFAAYRADPMIRVRVTDDLSALEEAEFWTRLAPRLFLERLDGRLADRPPLSASEAEDDPYRLLAVRLRAKTKLRGARMRLTGADYPLWIKTPGQAHYVELRVASVLAAALRARATGWDGDRALTLREEETCRRALLGASLGGVTVVPERAHRSVLERQLRPLHEARFSGSAGAPFWA